MGVSGRGCRVGAVLAIFVVGAAAQEAPGRPAVGDGGKAAGAVATVTYTFDRPGLSVPRFRMTVREDGTGSFAGDEVLAAGAGPGDARGPTTHVARGITLSAATTAKVFKEARAERYFNVACASRAKNIADTGAKTLSYEGPDGKGSCAYNYSENKDVVMLTELFLAISTTLDEGRRLEFKSRYDRLGLDAELEVLREANDSGRAVELGTIAPVLRQLAGDTEMMERVRLRAAKLLDRAANGR
jgi:hypothetical protein